MNLKKLDLKKTENIIKEEKCSSLNYHKKKNIGNLNPQNNFSTKRLLTNNNSNSKSKKTAYNNNISNAKNYSNSNNTLYISSNANESNNFYNFNSQKASSGFISAKNFLQSSNFNISKGEYENLNILKKFELWKTIDNEISTNNFEDMKKSIRILEHYVKFLKVKK